MTSKKEQRRSRRRAEKTMELAWSELHAGRPERAERESARAIEMGRVNPRLWWDRGRILELCGDAAGAEAAYRAAISLAPTYAAAFASLAGLQARAGKMDAAERLQRRAVELDPTDEARALLQSYSVELGDDEPEPVAVVEAPVWTELTERFDWEEVADEMLRRGLAVLPDLLPAASCRELAARWDVDRDLGSARPCDDELALCVRCPVAEPAPALVASLGREIYARAAIVANRWQELFGRAALPSTLDAARPAAPEWIHYPPGGFEAPGGGECGTRDGFPLRLHVVVAGAQTFHLVDRRPGKKRHASDRELRAGDAVLFGRRERPVRVGGLPGLQPVTFGCSGAEERIVLALSLAV